MEIIIIIMSITPVSSSDEDIGGVPSMQSSYSAGMKRCGICMMIEIVSGQGGLTLKLNPKVPYSVHLPTINLRALSQTSLRPKVEQKQMSILKMQSFVND